MNLRIRLYLKSIEGAFIRSVGTTERRGFKIAEAHFGPETDGQRTLELALEPTDRAVDVLMRQLARLHDVVRVEPVEEAWPRAAVAAEVRT